MDTAQLDNFFLGILQNCGQIEPFLDVVFSFLARRTDFYVIMNNKGDKMGFPDGMAEKMVLKIFKKYQRLVLGSMAKDKELKPTKTKAEKKKEKTVSSQPTQKPTTEVEKKSCKQPTTPEEIDTTPAVPEVVATTIEVSSTDSSQSQTENNQGSKEAIEDQKSENQPSTSTASSSTPSSSTEESNTLAPGKLPDCYNGAVLDKYTWSQTIKDIDLKIPVPKCVRKARDVTVEIKSSSLRVSLKGNIPPEELKTGSNILVDGELQRCVKCEESMWSLEPGKCIQINLEKTEERFWTAICKGDPEIDRTKVDSTRPIDDFDDQTQTDFQQVMFDHQQKMMGKPTSKEQKTHELLKQAWNAKGSPFAGTPFDPSKVNLSG